MVSPHGISNNFITDNPEMRRTRSPLVMVISIIAAITVAAGLLIGVLVWRKWHEEKTIVEKQPPAEAQRAALPAKVQIYMDEPVRKGSQALVSGTVQNISNETLSNITVEVELSHKKDTGTELRSLEVSPKELVPDQKGKYALTLEGDYRSYKLLRIKSGPKTEEIGFIPAPGAKRPVERASEPKTIIVNRPSSPRKGEEFINTPDNPARIP